MNKKGQLEGMFKIIIFFGLLFMILVIGFIAVLVMGIVDYASDEITPIMEELGTVENANLSQASSYTFGTVDTVVNAFPLIIAMGYIFAIIFSVVFAISYDSSPHPSLIGIYLVFVLLLIFGCIIISNVYEDLYTGTDEIAQRYQEQAIMSYAILYSPFIMSLIAFITGIYLFSGQREHEGGTGI